MVRRPRPVAPASPAMISEWLNDARDVTQMNRADLQSRVDALRWFHTIDLGDGVVTRGTDESAGRLARLQLPEDLSGKTVLDIGAWDGFYSFEAERRHASRVVASDHYAWHGVGWGTGRGKAGFELAQTIDQGLPRMAYGQQHDRVADALDQDFSAFKTIGLRQSDCLAATIGKQLGGIHGAPRI